MRAVHSERITPRDPKPLQSRRAENQNRSPQVLKGKELVGTRAKQSQPRWPSMGGGAAFFTQAGGVTTVM
jgi:hypothetical protein